VDVVDEVEIGPLVPGGDEGERAAVRTPHDVLAVGVPGGDLHRGRRRNGVVDGVHRQVEHEDLAAAVHQEADVVEAVLQGRDQPRRLRTRGNALGGAVPPLLRHPRRVRQPPRVRRPHRRAGPQRMLRQPSSHPAGGGQDVHLRLPARLGAQVRQPAAVRRERRFGVPVPAGQRPGRRGAVGRDGPQLAPVLVGLEVETGDGDDGDPPVRRHGRDARRPEQGEVGGPHDAGR
jgi:hypothetical protein